MVVRPIFPKTGLLVFNLLVVFLLALGCASDEQKLTDFMSRGDEYRESGQFDEAIIEYRTVLQTNSTGCIVIKRTDEVGRVRLTMRATGFRRGFRLAIIAPAGKGDYPSDQEYGHIATDATGFSDGTEGYRIF